jgi:hypothetical protein
MISMPMSNQDFSNLTRINFSFSKLSLCSFATVNQNIITLILQKHSGMITPSCGDRTSSAQKCQSYLLSHKTITKNSFLFVGGKLLPSPRRGSGLKIKDFLKIYCFAKTFKVNFIGIIKRP